MLSTMPPLLSLALLCSVLFLAASQDVEIGELSDIDHDVSGTVFAVDSRTLRIENFNYDGEGPAAVFWADVGGSATSSGQRVPFKDSCTAPSRLPRNTNTDVLLELPPSLTLADIGYFSVWCEAVGTEFGGIAIPSSIASQVPPLPTASCADDSASSPMTGPFPVQEGWNCEPLNREFQVRWQIVGDTANFQLVARLGDEDRYMGFGPSGATDRTEMIGR